MTNDENIPVAIRHSSFVIRHCLLIASSALVLSTLILPSATLAHDIPPPPGQWLTDRAGILSRADADRLNTKLREFESRSGTQFIIYTLPSLEGEALEDFTVRAAEKWKVGQKKYDDGLILFVFSKDRKLRIEVGYGLEEKVTDAYASRVIRETIVPRFRNGDYAGALDSAASQLIAKIEGKAPPEPLGAPIDAPREPRQEYSCGDVGFGIIFFIVVMLVLMSISRKGCLPIFFLPGGGGGVTFGGGGFRSGGGGFGSGGGGGGFSGGGGSFGGGGASGSW